MMTTVEARPRESSHRAASSVGLVALGLLLSAVSPILFGGMTLVPASLGLAAALMVVPFPAADRLLALGLIGTTPLLLDASLPNLPLAAAVLPVALVRVAMDQQRSIGRWTAVGLVLMWAPLAIGVLLSFWPAPSVWLRPLALLGLGALASVLGALVWREPDRLARWLEGIIVGLVIVAVSAALVFGLQFLVNPAALVEGMADAQALLRGAGASEKFSSQNNWLIVGSEVTLRAISPLFPSPNNLGAYLGVAAPLAVVVSFARRSPGWNALALAGTGVAAGVTVLTYSRSTWLAAATTGAVMALVLLTSQRIRESLPEVRERLPVMAVVVVTAVVLAGVATVLVGTSDTLTRVTTPLEDKSVTDRLATDHQAIDAISTNLFRGAGLGNWRAALEGYANVTYIHNAYLEYAAAAGIFGGIWTAIIVMVPLLTGLTLTSGRIPTQRSLLLPTAALGIGIFAAVHFLFDDNLLNPQYAWLYLFVVGGSIALVAEAPLRRRSPEAAESWGI